MNNHQNKTSQQWPNDLKLSDCVGLAGRVPPGETQENQAESTIAPDEEARGMTARSSSLERMVRRLRSDSGLSNDSKINLMDMSVNWTPEQEAKIRERIKAVCPESDPNLVVMGKKDIPDHLHQYFEFCSYQSERLESCCSSPETLQSTNSPRHTETDEPRLDQSCS